MDGTSKRCFVIQRFDGDKYDRRYDEVFAPAVRATGLEPYRVDRDPKADIPIDAIEKEIDEATICLADITEDNPNVWYEVGYAYARRKRFVWFVGLNEQQNFRLTFNIGVSKSCKGRLQAIFAQLKQVSKSE